MSIASRRVSDLVQYGSFSLLYLHNSDSIIILIILSWQDFGKILVKQFCPFVFQLRINR